MNGKNGSINLSLVDPARETVVVDLRPVQNFKNFEMKSKMMIVDDLSEKMWNHSIFTNCVINWNFLPSQLYDFAFSIGFERTLEEIQQTACKKGIGNKGAYLRRRLLTLQEAMNE